MLHRLATNTKMISLVESRCLVPGSGLFPTIIDVLQLMKYTFEWPVQKLL